MHYSDGWIIIIKLSQLAITYHRLQCEYVYKVSISISESMRALITKAFPSQISDHPINPLESGAKMSPGKCPTYPLLGGPKTLLGRCTTYPLLGGAKSSPT